MSTFAADTPLNEQKLVNIMPMDMLQLIYKFHPSHITFAEHKVKMNSLIYEIKTFTKCLNCDDIKKPSVIHEDYCCSICDIQSRDGGYTIFL